MNICLSVFPIWLPVDQSVDWPIRVLEGDLRALYSSAMFSSLAHLIEYLDNSCLKNGPILLMLVQSDKLLLATVFLLV